MRQCAINKCRLCEITDVIAPLSGATLDAGAGRDSLEAYEETGQKTKSSTKAEATIMIDGRLALSSI